jgi:CPA2 family monovalent cation:H+ antiporter-2
MFHGTSDEAETIESAQPRLHAVTLIGDARAIGKSLAAVGLDEIGVQVKAVRRPGAAEMRLLQC